MADLHMGAAEAKFAELIWSNEPITSGNLAKLAEDAMQWKKTTSFTVLKRLCQRGLFENNSGTVVSLVGKEEYYALHSEHYVEETFGGSLPAFLAAFSRKKKLSDQEYEEMRKLIDQMRG